ncbi:hypothetical protein [Elioraea rosea]|uniref:hypothetical protein n=1 Tax=Elioraea rosea TaxID=2492390 RepID=UPI001183A3E7|nr:hypothetical protein [Elioraea rosea]
MRQGEAVVAIWNDVVPEGLAAFHAWHIAEHMPERVAIPGFRRGRRAVSPDSAQRFFTIYEVASLDVLTGHDYTARLNAPTEATQANIPNFRNTVRALAHVAAGTGHGTGGWIETLRLDARPADALLHRLLQAPRIVAAHLCRTDMPASGVVTREKAGRTTLDRPPDWFLIVEATDAPALDAALSGAEGRRDRFILEQILSEIDLGA